MSAENKLNQYEAALPEPIPLYGVSASEMLFDAAQNLAANAADFGRKYYKAGIRLASILAIAGACQAATPEPEPTVAGIERIPTVAATLPPSPEPSPSPSLPPSPSPSPSPEPSPSPTATETPAPTDTPEPSPTPEFQFESYGVYMGMIEELEDPILIGILPNGKAVIQPWSRALLCTDQETEILRFVGGGSHDGASFNFEQPFSPTFIEGKVTEEGMIEGTVHGEEFPITGGGKCQAFSFPFKAKLVGQGKESLINAHLELNPVGRESAVRNLEISCDCTLPEG